MLKSLRSRRTDYVLRTFFNNKFFTKGWGDPEIFQRCNEFLAWPSDERSFVRDVYGVLENVSKGLKISKGKKLGKDEAAPWLFTGEFHSPLNHFVPGALPEQCEKVRFEVILPKDFKKQQYGHKPICMHFPHTGDHGFKWRRYMTAKPLAKNHGIGSIILQNPFYGCRKPDDQTGSGVNHVSDIFVMGVGLLMETIILLLWCQEKGLGPLGISGVSMGGHMATVAQTGWFEPLSVVPCLAWTSAAPCYTKGVLSHAVEWTTLEHQLNDDPRYERLLRNDTNYLNKFNSHYLHPQEELVNVAQQVEGRSYNLPAVVSKPYQEVHDKLIIPLYERGRAIGLVIIEADMFKHVTSLSASALDSVSIASLVNRKNSEIFQPSEHTTDFMCRLMDQATHLSHLKAPCDGSSIVYVTALQDGYFPGECYRTSPQDVWNNVVVKEVDCGHAMGIAWHQKDFNDAIIQSFRMMGCQLPG